MDTDQSSSQVDVTYNDSNAIMTGLSWIAYVKQIPVNLLYVAIMYATHVFITGLNLEMFQYAVYAVSIASIAYNIMLTKSVKFVINSNGVWVTKGILPWKKSCVGLRWPNIGIASFNNNLYTWLFKAYRISLDDRYTAKTELVANDIANGQFIVGEINRILSSKNHA